MSIAVRYSTKVTPSLSGSGSNALSLPIRLLLPPARMIPVILSNIAMSCVSPVDLCSYPGERTATISSVQLLAGRGCFALATLGNILLAILIGPVICTLLWILAHQVHNPGNCPGEQGSHPQVAAAQPGKEEWIQAFAC